MHVKSLRASAGWIYSKLQLKTLSQRRGRLVCPGPADSLPFDSALLTDAAIKPNIAMENRSRKRLNFENLKYR